jgi:hypothetical protein
VVGQYIFGSLLKHLILLLRRRLLLCVCLFLTFELAGCWELGVVTSCDAGAGSLDQGLAIITIDYRLLYYFRIWIDCMLKTTRYS